MSVTAGDFLQEQSDMQKITCGHKPPKSPSPPGSNKLNGFKKHIIYFYQTPIQINVFSWGNGDFLHLKFWGNREFRH